MVYSQLVGDEDADDLIEYIFTAHPKINCLHARNAASFAKLNG